MLLPAPCSPAAIAIARPVGPIPGRTAATRSLLFEAAGRSTDPSSRRRHVTVSFERVPSRHVTATFEQVPSARVASISKRAPNRFVTSISSAHSEPYYEFDSNANPSPFRATARNAERSLERDNLRTKFAWSAIAVTYRQRQGWVSPSGSFAVQGRDRNSRAHHGRAARSARRSGRARCRKERPHPWRCEPPPPLRREPPPPLRREPPTPLRRPFDATTDASASLR